MAVEAAAGFDEDEVEEDAGISIRDGFVSYPKTSVSCRSKLSRNGSSFISAGSDTENGHEDDDNKIGSQNCLISFTSYPI